MINPKPTTQWSVIATTQCFSQHAWHCDWWVCEAR